MILDFGDGFSLRQATADDHAALCRVCLLTGNAGRDASEREDDPDLLGLIYAMPYQVLEPDLAFAIVGPNGVAGYLFGARDTASFNARLAANWYPTLRRRYPEPDADSSRGSDWARRLIHHPDLAVPASLAPYPAHGHIDLLPDARGRGIGRRAMNLLVQRLAEAGSPGLHLQVDPRNRGARQFYRKLGFTELGESDLPRHSIYVARVLSER